MIKTSIEESDDVNALAEAAGLSYPISISNELSELLKPSAFLAELGIQHEVRINSILNILKASLYPVLSGSKETMPESGIIFPVPLVKGPYIREEMVSIKAELMTDDGGKLKILLTAVLDSE